ncbi:unnamed protein product [Onchocerca flexuosa]|uniref:Xanthine/uracil/thiamine/ascorbate permease family protein n=1 Tax=Onchocerca flexuosa TaxID=387005 RepID=A0A183HE76_9BILA|nr:unnamed protein product [Onchocerca flexuosa]
MRYAGWLHYLNAAATAAAVINAPQGCGTNWLPLLLPAAR